MSIRHHHEHTIGVQRGSLGYRPHRARHYGVYFFEMKKLLSESMGLFLAVAIFGFAGCTTNPETGRHQLNLISGGQEMQLGLTSFDQLKKETPISRDPAANALVQK